MLCARRLAEVLRYTKSRQRSIHDHVCVNLATELKLFTQLPDSKINFFLYIFAFLRLDNQVTQSRLIVSRLLIDYPTLGERLSHSRAAASSCRRKIPSPLKKIRLQSPTAFTTSTNRSCKYLLRCAIPGGTIYNERIYSSSSTLPETANMTEASLQVRGNPFRHSRHPACVPPSS